jgi:proline dehydrogenase
MPILNKLITTALPIIPKIIIEKVSKRYIAGSRLTDGIHAVKILNQNQMMSTMDLLGEDVKNAREIEAVRQGIISVLTSIKENGLDSTVSIKPTQLGLKIERELAYRNIKSIIEEAKRQNNFVRIDMEDATTTANTLGTYYRLREEGFANTGVAIQAYMRRSENDVLELVKKQANIRLCKGIYNESSTIAYKNKDEIRNNFLKLLQIMLEGGSYVGIATHDDYLIDRAYTMIQKLGLKKEQYEFQMLLGVRERIRDEIVKNGHRLRIYVPFGEQWYAYSMRRLKENPHMAWYITKAIFTD